MYEFIISKSIAQNQFRDMLEELACEAVTIGFVLRPEFGQNLKLRAMMDELAPHVVSTERASKWPGTQLVGHQVDVVRCRASKGMVDLVCAHWPDIFGDAGTGYAEDLFVEGAGGTVLLETISHEMDGVIRVPKQTRIICDLLELGFIEPLR